MSVMFGSAQATSLITRELEEVLAVGVTISFSPSAGELLFKEADGTVTVIARMNPVVALPGTTFAVRLNLDIAGQVHRQELYFDDIGNLIVKGPSEEVKALRAEAEERERKLLEIRKRKAIESIIDASR